jgi:hypothetical protein
MRCTLPICPSCPAYGTRSTDVEYDGFLLSERLQRVGGKFTSETTRLRSTERRELIPVVGGLIDEYSSMLKAVDVAPRVSEIVGERGGMPSRMGDTTR